MAKAKKTNTGNKQKGAETLAASVQPAKMNATQRLAALEQLVVSYDQKFNIVAEELDKMAGYINNLTRRLNASIQAAEEGSLNSASVKKIIIDQNVKDLEGKVEMLTQQGVLNRNDEMTIVDNSFIVGREVDEEGNVINPRIQFLVGSLEQSYKDGLLGKKLGDTYKSDDSKISLEILEIYEVGAPNKEQTFEDGDKNPDGPGAETAQ